MLIRIQLLLAFIVAIASQTGRADVTITQNVVYAHQPGLALTCDVFIPADELSHLTGTYLALKTLQGYSSEQMGEFSLTAAVAQLVERRFRKA